LAQADPPLKPEYQAIWEERQRLVREANERGEPLATTTIDCLPQGMPSMMGMGYGMEIMQNAERITLFSEHQDALRRVYLDGREAGQLPLEPLTDLPPGRHNVRLSKSGFYDYEAKYAAGGSKHILPAELPADVTERCLDLALLSPLVGQFAVEHGRIAVYPRGLLYAGKMHELWMLRHKGLQAIGEARFVENEVLHQAQHGRAEGVGRLHAIDSRSFGNAGAANAMGAFDHRDIASAAPQIVGGHQSVDAGADDEHTRLSHACTHLFYSAGLSD